MEKRRKAWRIPILVLSTIAIGDAAGLGRIHGRVRMAQQVAGIGAVLGIAGAPDAERCVDALPIGQHDRLGHAVGDMEFDRGGVKLVVDPLSLQYLSGAQVDFIDDLMGTRFVVNNPNAATTCGCGASFGI